jgi:hypothetical protein
VTGDGDGDGDGNGNGNGNGSAKCLEKVTNCHSYPLLFC